MFNDTTGQWFIYGLRGPGIWVESSELLIQSLITEIMRCSNVYHHLKSLSFITNIRSCLQCTPDILNIGYAENPRNTFVYLSRYGL